MSIGKILLGAGAAYLLYETGILSSLTNGLIPHPAATGSSSTTPSNPSVPTPTNTEAQVLNAAGGGNPMLTFDQWNFFYKGVRNLAGPDPSQFLSPANRSENLSLAEWWAYMTSAGFSGLGNYIPSHSGLGAYIPSHSGLGWMMSQSDWVPTPENPFYAIPRFAWDGPSAATLPAPIRPVGLPQTARHMRKGNVLRIGATPKSGGCAGC